MWHRLRALPDPTGGYTRPKFLNPRGERVRLYNASETQRDVVWITEGETDAMTMLSYTLQTGSPWGVVGVPGASAFREHWKWLFVNASVRIVFDGDEAGRLEARKLGRLLREVVSDVHVVDVPDGMDLNDLWTADRLHEVT